MGYNNDKQNIYFDIFKKKIQCFVESYITPEIIEMFSK